MLPRAALGSLMALTVFAAPAPGQVKLQWKFKEGDKFFLEEKLVSKWTSTIGDQKHAVQMTQTRVSSLLVKKQTGDGFELEQRIDSWKMRTAGNLAGAEEGAKLLEEISKEIVFTIHLKSSGEITAFKGTDEFIKRITEKDKEEGAKFEAIGGKEVLRSMIALTFDVLPSTVVKKGDTWKKETALPMGPLGNYKLAMTYDDIVKEEDGEKIGIKGVVSIQPAKADAADLGFKVVKIDLTSSEITGTMVFDAARGRLVKTQWTAPVVGTMTVQRQGELTKISIDGTETRTFRLLDKKPPAD